MMSEEIKVLIVDDHRLIRETMSVHLQRHPRLNVVGVADNAETAIAEAINHYPDVILMDIDMPGMMCFDAARTIHSLFARTKIIFLSAFFHDRYIEEALDVKAVGYLTKQESPDSIANAIVEVFAGRTCFSTEVLSRIVIDKQGAAIQSSAITRTSNLTNRELEILRYLARGMSKKEIARMLGRSVRTVENHSTHLMNKLDIHDRVELTRFAIREGLADV